MRTKKIWYLGFWSTFDFENNFIINTFRKYCEVVVDGSDPDYLVFTRYDTEVYKYQCVRIFYNPENFSLDFNLCDYAIGFDEISFLDRYLRYPLYLISDYTYYPGDDYAWDYKMMQEKCSFSSSDMHRKEHFCGMVVSRGGCNERDYFFEKLCEYKMVCSGGAWKNNIGGERVADKHQFLAACKFSIAFENSSTPGYCTEKLMQAFAAGTVPIYYGDPHVGLQFNSNAFVNVHEFASIEDAIKYIQKIDEDDELYIKMMQQPALLPGYAEKKRAQLDTFLRNIIMQEPEKAIRRHGQVIGFYEDRYRFSVEAWKVKATLSSIKNKLLLRGK